MITLTPATMDDLPALEPIDKECDAYFLFDPTCEENHSCPLAECLTVGDLPPGGVRENYYFYCIRQEDTLIGFLAYYLGYPEKDAAYLSVLYIAEAYRRRGIGAEALAAATQMLLDAHMRGIRLHVSLRNVTALRFWVRQGFDRIMGVECHGNLLPGTFAGIELMKEIT